jgi:hypothetical protein
MHHPDIPPNHARATLVPRLLRQPAMKKIAHKLTLSAETVRNLSVDQLGRVAGGLIRDTLQISCAKACGPSDLNICVVTR